MEWGSGRTLGREDGRAAWWEMSSWGSPAKACERRTIVASGLHFVSKNSTRVDEDRTMVQRQRRRGRRRSEMEADRRVRVARSPDASLGISRACLVLFHQFSLLSFDRDPELCPAYVARACTTALPLGRVSRITMTSVIPPHGLGAAGVSSPAFGGCTIVRLSASVSQSCVHCMHRLRYL
jgi:hypothetical protein